MMAILVNLSPSENSHVLPLLFVRWFFYLWFCNGSECFLLNKLVGQRVYYSEGIFIKEQTAMLCWRLVQKVKENNGKKGK